MACFLGRCTGEEENSNCATDDDCTTEMYCAITPKWPFDTTCRALLSDGEICTKDTQCNVKSWCHYKDAADVVADTRTCMPIYAAETGATFGWKSLKD